MSDTEDDDTDSLLSLQELRYSEIYRVSALHFKVVHAWPCIKYSRYQIQVSRFSVSAHKLTIKYTCQLSRIMRESHACGLKTAISRIEDNFSRLTYKSGRVVLKKLHFNSDSLCIISLLLITIAKAFKCLQSVYFNVYFFFRLWINSVIIKTNKQSTDRLNVFQMAYTELYLIMRLNASCYRSEINDARLESLDRSFEDPEHPTLGTRLDRR